jgi:hypothetical protein
MTAGSGTDTFVTTGLFGCAGSVAAYPAGMTAGSGSTISPLAEEELAAGEDADEGVVESLPFVVVEAGRSAADCGVRVLLPKTGAALGLL